MEKQELCWILLLLLLLVVQILLLSIRLKEDETEQYCKWCFWCCGNRNRSLLLLRTDLGTAICFMCSFLFVDGGEDDDEDGDGDDGDDDGCTVT